MNICSQCTHLTGDRNWCNDCLGNSRLVDNFNQKETKPLKGKPATKRNVSGWGMKMGYRDD